MGAVMLVSDDVLSGDVVSGDGSVGRKKPSATIGLGRRTAKDSSVRPSDTM